MIHDLTQDERRLAEFLSELSERCYSAGWMADLEYVLWDAVKSGPRTYGHDKITQDDINILIEDSDKSNSWIVFDDEQEETSVPLDKWRLKFAEDISKDSRRLQW